MNTCGGRAQRQTNRALRRRRTRGGGAAATLDVGRTAGGSGSPPFFTCRHLSRPRPSLFTTAIYSGYQRAVACMGPWSSCDRNRATLTPPLPPLSAFWPQSCHPRDPSPDPVPPFGAKHLVLAAARHTSQSLPASRKDLWRAEWEICDPPAPPRPTAPLRLSTARKRLGSSRQQSVVGSDRAPPVRLLRLRRSGRRLVSRGAAVPAFPVGGPGTRRQGNPGQCQGQGGGGGSGGGGGLSGRLSEARAGVITSTTRQQEAEGCRLGASSTDSCSGPCVSGEHGTGV